MKDSSAQNQLNPSDLQDAQQTSSRVLMVNVSPSAVYVMVYGTVYTVKTKPHSAFPLLPNPLLLFATVTSTDVQMKLASP
jgi:hypothetical protein